MTKGRSGTSHGAVVTMRTMAEITLLLLLSVVSLVNGFSSPRILTSTTPTLHQTGGGISRNRSPSVRPFHLHHQDQLLSSTRLSSSSLSTATSGSSIPSTPTTRMRKTNALFGSPSSKSKSNRMAANLFRSAGVLFTLMISLISFPWKASAGLPWTKAAAAPLPPPTALSSAAKTFLMTLWKDKPRLWKTSKRLAITTFALVFVIRYARLRKRQALDATSEWARYANYPATRGRALGSLFCFQLLPLWVLTQICRVTRLKAAANRLRVKTGNVFADGLLRLGPLYIKMGQILSCRDNLFPEPWIKAMEKLQDQVPSKRGQDALELAYEAMGSREAFEEVFEEFDSEPLAAASLGQVHKAKLQPKYRLPTSRDPNGDGVVAVKIQRAKLREIYDQDLVVMNKIAAVMDKMSEWGGDNAASNVGGVSQSWVEIFEDAEEILYREIDYRDEATNARRFANDFGIDIGGKSISTSEQLALQRQQQQQQAQQAQQANTTTTSSSSSIMPIATSKDGEILPSAASWLRTPYVYKDLSTEKVLVMEYVPSIKITNKAKLEAANITEEEKVYLSDMLARSYLRQFCCNLFFSTDPHPGNLGVEILDTTNNKGSSSTSKANTPENRVRLVFYDFGQAASLTENQADGILDIMEAIIDMDVERSVEAFQTMGVLKEDANLDMVRAKVSDNYKTGKIKANQKKLKKQGYKSTKQREQEASAKTKQQGSTTTITTTTTTTTNATAATTNATTTTTSSGGGSNDAEVMKFFSLPAEYAFVARALSQMDGVGKTLDPDFDFVSSGAPYIVEIKGAGKYLKDEFFKKLNNIWTELTGGGGGGVRRS